jgi:hypothetical protein
LSETATAIAAFFESYRSAFERFDSAAVADHFAFPCHVTGDGDPVTLSPVGDKQLWIGQLERLLGMHRAVGVTSARLAGLEVSELSPRLYQAAVHWKLFDASGRPLYGFEAVYTLAIVEGGLRVAAIAHNEMPRYRECVARLKGEQH